MSDLRTSRLKEEDIGEKGIKMKEKERHITSKRENEYNYLPVHMPG